MNRSVAFGLILGLASAGFSAAPQAATFVVNSDLDVLDAAPGDGVCATATATCTLRAAITEANALAGADVITLPAGTYTTTLAGASENNNVSGDYDLTSEITINGAGSATTIVQAATTPGTAVERVFHLRAAFPMMLNDLTIRHGRYTTAANTFGGGVRVDSAAVIATFNRVVIANNEDGSSGGGLAISGANNSVTTLNNCRVENNIAGGLLAGSSTGAGIMLNSVSGTLNINDSTISGNSVSNSSTTVGASGGGISSVGTLFITNSFVTNNTATSTGSTSFSGGVHVTNGTTTIVGSSITGNASTVTAGTGSGFAGGIYNQQATVNLTNSILSGNTASSFHGAIRALASTAPATTNITNSTISNNTAVGEGGGVVNFSVGAANATVNITGSTISGNTATDPASVGGGLENFSNAAGLAAINVTNSSISGNAAGSAAGAYNTGAASSINFNFSTIANNTAAGDGGGLLQDGPGNINLRNSIVADNSAATGPDISGVISSQGWNHVEDVTGGTFAIVSGDITGSDPQLGALANNGGTTLTHLPAQTSPVLNIIPSGTNDCGTVVTTSQNGVVRPEETGCEKGSVEALAIPTFTIGGNVSTLFGSGLVLRNNGGDDLSIGANGAFTFATSIATGAAYNVTVFTNPTSPAQTCAVTDGSGTVGAANVTNVAVTCTPSAFADLSITKTDGVTSATPGGSVTYTISASNAGPSSAPGATVADTFPAALTCTWTCVGAGGGTCTAAGAGNINATVNLPNGASTTFTASCTISAAATGTLTNTATVTAPAGVTDPTPGNNSATDTDTLGASADLVITKTDGVTSATPGGSVTYTIVASNVGPSNAPGATLADTFPAALTCTWTCVGAGGGTCTAAGAGNINDTVNLPNGASTTFTATCSISAAATGTLTNTAIVTAPAGVTDPTPGNNSATDTDTLGASADLAITKTDGVTSATPGTNTTYTIVTSNAGPSAAPGTTVADTFPASCVGVTWTCVGAGGGTCTAAGTGNINDAVNLPSGASATYTATCPISAAATGTLSNTATVTAPAGVTDPAPGNNSATDSDTLGASADLLVGLSTSNSVVATNVPVTFTATSLNQGPSDAQNVSITVTLTAGFSFTSANAAGATCTTPAVGSAGAVVCTWDGSTAPGVTRTASVVATRNIEGSGVVNASTTSNTSDPTAANNARSVTVQTPTIVTPIPSLNMIGLMLLGILFGVIGLVAVRRT